MVIYLEGATHDATTMLGVGQGRLYKLLGQLEIGSKGILDSGSVPISRIVGCVGSFSTVRRVIWYEITQLDAQEFEETS